MSEKPSIPVDTAFHPEQQQQAQQDFDAYLATRPHKDVIGRVHSPETGAVIDSDQYFDAKREVAEVESMPTAYEDMQPSQLTRNLAQAEFHGDKTSAGNISDVLDGKLAVMGRNSFSERDDSSTSSTREHPDNDVNHNDLRSQKLEDRIVTIHSRETERLNAEEPKSEEPGNTQPEANEDSDSTNGQDDIHTQETTEIPTAEDNTPPTEQMPVEPGAIHESAEVGSEPEPKQETRWDRLKRGFWKHMYEAPVDMTPMGPAAQPEIPFDEWYAQKRAGAGEPGKVGRAFNKATDKIVGMAGNTVENMGDAAAYVDYVGNIALINTAYYAGEAYARTRDQLEEAKIRAKEYGIDAMLLAGNAGSIAAEKARKATESTDYMGQLMLDRMATLPPQVRDLLQKNRVEVEEDEAERTHQADRLNVDIISRKHNWD